MKWRTEEHIILLSVILESIPLYSDIISGRHSGIRRLRSWRFNSKFNSLNFQRQQEQNIFLSNIIDLHSLVKVSKCRVLSSKQCKIGSKAARDIGLHIPCVAKHYIYIPSHKIESLLEAAISVKAYRTCWLAHSGIHLDFRGTTLYSSCFSVSPSEHWMTLSSTPQSWLSHC